LDRDGMVLAEVDKPGRWFGGRERAATDITGAGDTVLAMLGVGLAGRMSLEGAVELAGVAAGLQVERPGVSQIRWHEIVADMTRHSPAMKVVSQGDLLGLAAGYRRLTRTIVLTNGCFDLL